MPINIGANFTYKGKLPNFERDSFTTKKEMHDFPETSIDDGHLSYCAEDGNTYQFKSSNSVDTVTGKWRIFKADVDLSAYATKDSVATGLDKKVDIAVPRYISFGHEHTNIKILSIKIPNIRYNTVYLKCAIASRYYNTDIIIDANTDYIPYRFDIIKSANNTADWDTKGDLYYFFDEVNYNLELYYNLVANDKIAVKVISTGGTTDFTYNTDIKKVDTIPENAILVEDRNYGTGNLFFATPNRMRGIAKLRAININDLPDLSSKYATKEKAFTKDTISTEPNQFLAGPINTKGNISLRKIDVSDLPDLSSKYQVMDSGGYQIYPRIAGARLRAREIDGVMRYLVVDILEPSTAKISPDWYYATDGTLQDITTKIPKVVLDDAVSTTSDNGVKNSVITQYVDSKVTTINSSIADVRTSLESTQTDFVDLRNKVNAMPKTVFITQAAYNALTTKDANTIYYING
ncbi:MAG: hypothetical protein SPG97_02450 [Bacilli bacterium]|nr:hypothetical protein [Bacilli bacterium]